MVQTDILDRNAVVKHLQPLYHKTNVPTFIYDTFPSESLSIYETSNTPAGMYKPSMWEVVNPSFKKPSCVNLGALYPGAHLSHGVL